jgi:hypothetical protein
MTAITADQGRARPSAIAIQPRDAESTNGMRYSRTNCPADLQSSDAFPALTDRERTPGRSDSGRKRRLPNDCLDIMSDVRRANAKSATTALFKLATHASYRIVEEELSAPQGG